MADNGLLPALSNDDVRRILGMEPEEPEEPKRTIGGTLKDVGVTLGNAAIGAGESVVGLGNLATFGGLGKALNAAGYDPKAARKFLSQYYSDAQQKANKEVEDAQGFWDTTAAMLRNPSTIAATAVESAPSMYLGGGIGGKLLGAATGRLAKAAQAGSKSAAKYFEKNAAGELLKDRAGQLMLSEAGRKALGRRYAAVGEGAIAGGALAEQMRQENADKELTGRQALYAGLGGALTGGIGRLGSGVANRMGVTDVDTLVTTGLRGAAQEGGKRLTAGQIAKGIGAGALQEGVFEELPQSMQEEVWSNLAAGRPWNENIGKAGAQGMMAGFVMGAGANARAGMPGAQREILEAQAAQERARMDALGRSLYARPDDVPSTQAGLDAMQAARNAEAAARAAGAQARLGYSGVVSKALAASNNGAPTSEADSAFATLPTTLPTPGDSALEAQGDERTRRQRVGEYLGERRDRRAAQPETDAQRIAREQAELELARNTPWGETVARAEAELAQARQTATTREEIRRAEDNLRMVVGLSRPHWGEQEEERLRQMDALAAAGRRQEQLWTEQVPQRLANLRGELGRRVEQQQAEEQHAIDHGLVYTGDTTIPANALVRGDRVQVRDAQGRPDIARVRGTTDDGRIILQDGVRMTFGEDEDVPIQALSLDEHAGRQRQGYGFKTKAERERLKEQKYQRKAVDAIFREEEKRRRQEEAEQRERWIEEHPAPTGRGDSALAAQGRNRTPEQLQAEAEHDARMQQPAPPPKPETKKERREREAKELERALQVATPLARDRVVKAQEKLKEAKAEKDADLIQAAENRLRAAVQNALKSAPETPTQEAPDHDLVERQYYVRRLSDAARGWIGYQAQKGLEGLLADAREAAPARRQARGKAKAEARAPYIEQEMRERGRQWQEREQAQQDAANEQARQANRAAGRQWMDEQAASGDIGPADGVTRANRAPRDEMESLMGHRSTSAMDQAEQAGAANQAKQQADTLMRQALQSPMSKAVKAARKELTAAKKTKDQTAIQRAEEHLARVVSNAVQARQQRLAVEQRKAQERMDRAQVAHDEKEAKYAAEQLRQVQEQRTALAQVLTNIAQGKPGDLTRALSGLAQQRTRQREGNAIQMPGPQTPALLPYLPQETTEPEEPPIPKPVEYNSAGRKKSGNATKARTASKTGVEGNRESGGISFNSEGAPMLGFRPGSTRRKAATTRAENVAAGTRENAKEVNRKPAGQSTITGKSERQMVTEEREGQPMPAPQAAPAKQEAPKQLEYKPQPTYPGEAVIPQGQQGGFGFRPKGQRQAQALLPLLPPQETQTPQERRTPPAYPGRPQAPALPRNERTTGATQERQAPAMPRQNPSLQRAMQAQQAEARTESEEATRPTREATREAAPKPAPAHDEFVETLRKNGWVVNALGITYRLVEVKSRPGTFRVVGENGDTRYNFGGKGLPLEEAAEKAWQLSAETERAVDFDGFIQRQQEAERQKNDRQIRQKRVQRKLAESKERLRQVAAAKERDDRIKAIKDRIQSLPFPHREPGESLKEYKDRRQALARAQREELARAYGLDTSTMDAAQAADQAVARRGLMKSALGVATDYQGTTRQEDVVNNAQAFLEEQRRLNAEQSTAENTTAEQNDTLSARKWTKPGKKVFKSGIPNPDIDYFGVRLNGGEDAGYTNGFIIIFGFVPDGVDTQKKGKEYDGADSLRVSMSHLGSDGEATGKLFPDSPYESIFDNALTYRGVLEGHAVFERARGEGALSALEIDDKYLNAIMYYAQKRHGKNADVRFIQDSRRNYRGQETNTGPVAVFVNGQPFSVVMPMRSVTPLNELLGKMRAARQEREADKAGKPEATAPPQTPSKGKRETETENLPGWAKDAGYTIRKAESGEGFEVYRDTDRLDGLSGTYEEALERVEGLTAVGFFFVKGKAKNDGGKRRIVYKIGFKNKRNGALRDDQFLDTPEFASTPEARVYLLAHLPELWERRAEKLKANNRTAQAEEPAEQKPESGVTQENFLAVLDYSRQVINSVGTTYVVQSMASRTGAYHVFAITKDGRREQLNKKGLPRDAAKQLAWETSEEERTGQREIAKDVRPLGWDEIGEAPVGTELQRGSKVYRKLKVGQWGRKGPNDTWYPLDYMGNLEQEKEWERRNPKEAARTRDPKYPYMTAYEQRNDIQRPYYDSEVEAMQDWGLPRLREHQNSKEYFIVSLKRLSYADVNSDGSVTVNIRNRAEDNKYELSLTDLRKNSSEIRKVIGIYATKDEAISAAVALVPRFAETTRQAGTETTATEDVTNPERHAFIERLRRTGPSRSRAIGPDGESYNIDETGGGRYTAFDGEGNVVGSFKTHEEAVQALADLVYPQEPTAEAGPSTIPQSDEIRDDGRPAQAEEPAEQNAVRPLGRDEIGEAPNGATAENADWQYQKRLNGWWFSKNGGQWQRVPDRGQNSIERLWEEQNPEEAARTRDPEYPNETAREQRARLLNMFPENEREEAQKWGLVRLREEAPAALQRKGDRREAMERMIEEDMRRFMDELRSNLQAVSPGGTTYTLQALKSKPAGRYRVNAVTPAGSPSVVVNKGVPLEEALGRVREKVNDEMSGRRLDADFWDTMNARLDAEEVAPATTGETTGETTAETTAEAGPSTVPQSDEIPVWTRNDIPAWKRGNMPEWLYALEDGKATLEELRREYVNEFVDGERITLGRYSIITNNSGKTFILKKGSDSLGSFSTKKEAAEEASKLQFPDAWRERFATTGLAQAEQAGTETGAETSSEPLTPAEVEEIKSHINNMWRRKATFTGKDGVSYTVKEQRLSGIENSKTGFLYTVTAKTANGKESKPAYSDTKAKAVTIVVGMINDNLKAAREQAGTEDESAPKKEKKDKGIADKLGEHIGGSRADMAQKTGPREKLPGIEDYDIREGEDGKFVVFRKGKPLMRWFSTAEEARKYVTDRVIDENFAVMLDPSEYTYVIYARTTKNGGRGVRLGYSFTTNDQARDAMRENLPRLLEERAEKIKETRRPKRKGFGEADLATAETSERVGKERRAGDATPDDFMSAFGFRGVEFGLWNKQSERQALLNDAYDALMDLADLLGIPPRALSLNGELALAFGARGRGGKARAHYEPDKVVINLTKTSGKGTLAHEWLHALDYYFGGRGERKGPMSEHYRQTPPENVRPEVFEAFKKVMSAIVSRPEGGRTKYYQAAIRFRNSDYWANRKELLARAFSAYIEDTLEERGEKSSFLSYGSTNALYGEEWANKPFPEGEERQAINRAFSEFFDTLEVDDSEGRAALYSKSDRAVPPEERANIEGELREALGRGKADSLLGDKGSVRIIETQEEARELAGRDNPTVKRAGNGTIQGFYLNGVAYLVRDGIAKGNVMGVLMHEYGEHAAQLGFADNVGYRAILKSLERRQNENSETGRAIQAAMERARNAGVNERDPHFWSEVAAYIVEANANIKTSTLDRVTNFFKKWLFKVSGLGADNFTHKDLVLFARAAVKAAGRTGAKARMQRGFLYSFAQALGVSPEQLQAEYDAVYAQYHGTPQWRKAPNGKDSNLNERQWVLVRTPRFKNWFGDWENDPENASKVVDANGEPMVVYHQTGEDFTVFDPRRPGAGQYDEQLPFGIFMKPDDGDIGLQGKRQMALFANIKNPFRVTNRAKLLEYLEENIPGYADLQVENNIQNSEYRSKLEALRQELSRRYAEWKKQHPGEGRRSDVRARISEELGINATQAEWEAAENALAARMKELVDRHFRESGHDGIILEEDMGGFGTKATMSIIAFERNQVKSATDNTGAFDPNNPDIRYSFAGEQGAAALDAAEEATTRLDNLAVARDMETAGKDAKTIKLATGWERGKDGKWRYEIDDSGVEVHLGRTVYDGERPEYMRLQELQSRYYGSVLGRDVRELSAKEEAEYKRLRSDIGAEFDKYIARRSESLEKGEYVYLASVLEHPELFRAYPQLRHLKVQLRDDMPDYGGLFGTDDRGGLYILMSADFRKNPIQARSVLLHEVQHAIQHIEGFAKGGTAEQLTDRDQQRLSNEALDKLQGIEREHRDAVRAFIVKNGRRYIDEWTDADIGEDGNTFADADWPYNIAGKNVTSLNALAQTVTDHMLDKGMTPETSLPDIIRDVDSAMHEFFESEGVYDNAPKKLAEIARRHKKQKDALDAIGTQDPLTTYKRLAGETEARNTQRRLDMTAEERRASLASETEDVAREDQIVLEQMLGNAAASNGPRFSIAASAPTTPAANPAANNTVTGQSFVDRVLANAKPKYQDMWERFIYNFLDTNDPRERVWEKAGSPTDQDFVTVERLRGKKTAAEQQKFREEMVTPLLKTLGQGKLAVSDLEEYAYAMHTPERNQKMREVNAKRNLDALRRHMPKAEAQDLQDRIDFVRTVGKANGWTQSDIQNAYLGMMEEVFNDIPRRETLLAQAQANLTAASSNNAHVDKMRRDLDETKAIRDRWRRESVRFAGQTDQEAQATIQKWQRDGRFRALQNAHNQLEAITAATLDVLHESGYLSDEEFLEIKNGYQHYVPLHRDGFLDTTPIKLMQVAKGSMRDVVNILPNVVRSHETAVNRKHKAAAGRALYDFAEANPDAGISIEEMEMKPTHDQEGNIVMYRSQAEPEDGIFVRVNGKKYLLRFAASSKTAEGRTLLRFLDSVKGSDAQLGGMTKALHWVTKKLAMVNTSLSPEFMVTNFARDLQTAFVHLNQKDIDMPGLQKAVAHDVFPAMRGIWAAERGDKTSVMAKWYADFQANGGKVGWMQGYEEAETLAKDLQKELKLYQPGNHGRKAFDKIKRLVEHGNAAIENCMRLATYKNLVERGVSKDKAARIASGLTVDFTQHGKMGPQINALYMFWNASVQGSVRMIQALASSKKVQAIAGGIASAGFLLQMLALAGGGDDDSGEPYVLGIPDAIRERNIIIMLPGSDGKYIKIPKAYGYGAIYDFGAEVANSLYMGAQGRKYNHAAGAMRVVNSFANSFNPIQSATMLQTLAPTLLDPVAYVSENRSWMGTPLMPEQSPYGPSKPDSERAWKGTSPIFKKLAKTLNDMTGGDAYKGGWADISPETFSMIWDNATGGMGRFIGNTLALPFTVAAGDTEAHKIPFARTVYGEWNDRAISSRYYEAMDRAEIAHMRFRNAESLPERKRLYQEPDHRLYLQSRKADAQIKKLRKRQQQLEAAGNKDGAERIRTRIVAAQSRVLAGMPN